MKNSFSCAPGEFNARDDDTWPGLWSCLPPHHARLPRSTCVSLPQQLLFRLPAPFHHHHHSKTSLNWSPLFFLVCSRAWPVRNVEVRLWGVFNQHVGRWSLACRAFPVSWRRSAHFEGRGGSFERLREDGSHSRGQLRKTSWFAKLANPPKTPVNGQLFLRGFPAHGLQAREDICQEAEEERRETESGGVTHQAGVQAARFTQAQDCREAQEPPAEAGPSSSQGRFTEAPAVSPGLEEDQQQPQGRLWVRV